MSALDSVTLDEVYGPGADFDAVFGQCELEYPPYRKKASSSSSTFDANFDATQQPEPAQTAKVDISRGA